MPLTPAEVEQLWLGGFQSPKTKAAYTRDLQIVAEVLGHRDWSRLDRATIMGVLDKLRTKYAPNTVRRINAALKSLSGELVTHDLITGPAYHGIRRQKLQIPKSDPVGRYVSREERAKLFHAAGVAAKTVEEAVVMRAALAMGFGAGMRRGEIAAFKKEDYDKDTGKIRIPNAKGGKERVVYVAGPAKDYVDAVVATRFSMRVFVLAGLWEQMRYKAGYPDLTPHDMRRSYASDLWDAGVDGATIADLLGHNNIETSRKYDRRGEHRKQRAAEALLKGGT